MKSQLVDHMKEHAGMTAAAADTALEAVAAAVLHVSSNPAGARIPGLGTFKVKERAARVGRNPRTGEPVNIPERSVLTFKEAGRG